MSNKKVTGDALNRILKANKEYIDNRDLGFEEIDVDPDTGYIIPEASFQSYSKLHSNNATTILNGTYKTSNDTDTK